MIAGNRAKSCKKDVELVRLRKLGLKEAALCRLRTSGLRRECHAKNGRLRRMSLQVQVEQLEQQITVLRSDGGTYVPLIRSGLLKLQAKGETTQSVCAFDGVAHDPLQHRRHNEKQRVHQDKRRVECRCLGENKVWFFRHEQMIFYATSETLKASRL